MTWSIALLAGCWRSTPAPRPIASAAADRADTCTDFMAETQTYRAQPQMLAAMKASISPPDDPLFIQAMNGPFANVGAACDECERLPLRGRYEQLARGGRTLALRIDRDWWAVDLAINDTCHLIYDAPIVRDLVTPAPGPELLLRITEECAYPGEPSPFAPPEPERNEHIVICGVGPSEKPSCMHAPFGHTEYKPEFSTHTRLDLACDGTATFTSWDGNDGDGYRYVRVRRPLRLP
jgi:hypothetical protein